MARGASFRSWSWGSWFAVEALSEVKTMKDFSNMEPEKVISMTRLNLAEILCVGLNRFICTDCYQKLQLFERKVHLCFSCKAESFFLTHIFSP